MRFVVEAIWRARRRSVSSMARRIESVMRSPVEDGLAVDVARARPIVWIRLRSARRKPSLSASRIATSETSGDVQALAQQVDADQHVEHAQAQVTEDLDALDGVDVRVQVAHLDAVVREVLGELLGHLLRAAW
jgi:hypothetical protein